MTRRRAQAVHEVILAELEAAFGRWYDGDPSAYERLFTEDLTYFAPVTDGRLEGIAALRELFAPIYGQIHVPRFEILDPKTQLEGDAAVFTYRLFEYAEDGAVAARWNGTNVYRREGDQWRIVHAPWSVAPPLE